MQVTKVTKIDNGNKIRAFVQVETKEGLILDGFKVIDGRNGLFVSAPARKNGEAWEDTVRFASDDIKQSFHEQVLLAYNNENGTEYAGKQEEDLF